LSTNDISINWELGIEHANYGRFSKTRTHDLTLSYSVEDKNGFHTYSKIIIVTNGVITEIYENALFLGTPVVDKNGFIFICTYDYIQDGKEEKSTLLKISPEGNVIWEYLLDAPVSLDPLLYQDSVLVFDFSGNEQIGHLHRINKNGVLIWKATFDGNSFVEPQIFKLNGQDSLFLHALDEFFILDMDGKILKNKRIGRPSHGLWINEAGNIYVAQYPNLLCLNTNLEINWVYKPKIGFAIHPSTDSKGFLYCTLTGHRMVSLDSNGKERWVAEVSGDYGHYPKILANSDILMVTEKKSGKKAPQIESNTYLEIFAIDGTKRLKHEFPGGSASTIYYTDNTLFLSTHCRSVFPFKHRVLNSEKVFSIHISDSGRF
jgi:hypothetical protein